VRLPPTLLVSLLAVVTPVVASHAASNICEAGKNNGAGKFELCAAKAERTLVATGDYTARDAAVAKCQSKLVPGWAVLESRAQASGQACRSVGDGAGAGEVLDQCARDVGFALNGDGNPDQSSLDCIPDFDACENDLDTCQTDLQACRAAPDDCTPQLDACVGSYAACDGTPMAVPPLQTHQSAAFGSNSDGEMRRGGLHSFVDNGDGTITDNATGLVWEKKDNAGGIHDYGNGYSWCADANSDFFCDTPGAPMDGTIVTDFLATLNAGGGFAGHNDWRIPNRFELQTLTDFGAEEAVAFPEFDTGCVSGCAASTCSCTRNDSYASSSAMVDPAFGEKFWIVNFHNGAAIHSFKSTALYKVRAVRGGL
jgi:uncharacterized protein DUF1566